jgi:selenide,water dikinase
VLAGAEALAAAGVRSSIWQANQRSSRVRGLRATARAGLLFDPQTAGGLLAAVPASESARLLAALAAAGETAAIIGRIEDGDPEIRLREA